MSNCRQCPNEGECNKQECTLHVHDNRRGLRSYFADLANSTRIVNPDFERQEGLCEDGYEETYE
jgi:hypothetical protein